MTLSILKYISTENFLRENDITSRSLQLYFWRHSINFNIICSNSQKVSQDFCFGEQVFKNILMAKQW